ncbi:MAG: C_GCAxxG_C_C family protein [Candidatus Aminicenantes bacterium]|nr:C_GCAxxG_C_C family protein [Candidatus Aminicenantes bacterium]
MTKAERAAATFQEGFSCSQAVLTAFSDDFGLDRDVALRISQALGGGLAHLGEACGAVTGAFMVIGLKHGRTRAEDLAARDKTYAVMQEFARKFRDLHCSLTCRCLLGCDIGTAEGMKAALEKNLFQTLCLHYVKDAAEIVDALL